MILKMILGKGARGLLSYISNPTKTNHNHTQPFFSNMAGQSARELSKEVAVLRRLKPNLKMAVAHLVLSHDPNDRPLTEAEWRHAISTALKTHGAEEAAFCSYLHLDTNHIHTHVFTCESCPVGRQSAIRIPTEKMRLLHASSKRSSN